MRNEEQHAPHEVICDASNRMAVMQSVASVSCRLQTAHLATTEARASDTVSTGYSHSTKTGARKGFACSNNIANTHITLARGPKLALVLHG